MSNGGYTGSDYTPVGVVHKGEYIFTGPRYPKHWYDRFLPFKVKRSIQRWRYPNVEKQWRSNMLGLFNKFDNEKEND